MNNGNFVVRDLPGLDTVIKQLEELAASSEPRGTYENELTDLILSLARTVRHYMQQVTL